MAFFGYDPFQGRGDLGRAVASAGQQIGGALQRLPQQAQALERGEQSLQLGEQQQEINDLQIQKMKDVEEQLQSNPSMIAQMGAVIAEQLWDEIEGMSEELQLKLSPKIELFQSNMKRYGTRSRMSQQEIQLAIKEMQSTHKMLQGEHSLERGLEAGAEADTQREFLGDVSKVSPTTPAKKFLETPLGASLPGEPKPIDANKAMDLRLKEEQLKQLKLKGAGAGRGRPLSARDKLAEEKFQIDTEFKAGDRIIKLRNDIDKAEKELKLGEHITNKWSQYLKDVEAGLKPEKPNENTLIAFWDHITKDDEEAPLPPTYLAPDGEKLPIDENVIGKIKAQRSIIEKRIKGLKKNTERQESILKKAQGAATPLGAEATAGAITPTGTADTSIVGDATKVGDYVGGWTSPTTKINKDRIKGFTEVDKYSDIIEEASAKYNVPVDIIRSIILQESYGKPEAKSKAGARGLMQLMPATAKELGVKNITDPRENIMGGTKYIAEQLKRFGNIEAALSGYNAGPGTTRKWLRKGSNYSKAKPETKTYVSMIRGYLEYLAGLKAPETPAPIGGETEAAATGLNQLDAGDVTGPPAPAVDPSTGNRIVDAAPDFPSAPAVVKDKPVKNKRVDVEEKFRLSWNAAGSNIAKKKDLLSRLQGIKARHPNLYKEMYNQYLEDIKAGAGVR